MTIINFLESNKNAPKLFTARDVQIIKKQIMGDKLTQPERNRLSRTIRPRLECIKEISEFHEEFGLRHNQQHRRIMDLAVKIILQDELIEKIRAILLFGSFANKTHTHQSDIDICVLLETTSIKEATEFRIRNSGKLPDIVDIQVFNVLPTNIKKEIAKNHKILFAKNFDNVAFTIHHLKDNDFLLRKKQIFGAT